MVTKAKRKAEEACAASRRVAKLARSIADDVSDRKDGVPMRAMSEDDSMVNSIENAMQAQHRAKRATNRPKTE